MHRHGGTTDRHARGDPTDVERSRRQSTDDPAPRRIAQRVQGCIYVSEH
jgi:hypothetical protein